MDEFCINQFTDHAKCKCFQGSISIADLTNSKLTGLECQESTAGGTAGQIVYLFIIMGINLTNHSITRGTVMHRRPQDRKSAINLSVISVSDRVRFPVLSQIKPWAPLLVVPFCQFLQVSICTYQPLRGDIGKRQSLGGVTTVCNSFSRSLGFSSVSWQWRKHNFQWIKKAQTDFLSLALELTLAASAGPGWSRRGKPQRPLCDASCVADETEIWRGPSGSDGPNLICEKAFGKGREIMELCWCIYVY